MLCPWSLIIVYIVHMYALPKVTIDNVFVVHVAENNCLCMALQRWTPPAQVLLSLLYLILKLLMQVDCVCWQRIQSHYLVALMKT